MKHDELLEKIKESFNDYNFRSPHRALFAIANLHRPSEVNPTHCFSCCKYGSEVSVLVGYPCLTIQAIEKELI
jgi:hypothetical protein